MKGLLIPVSPVYLVCGLQWRPLNKKTRAKDIRDAANESGLKHYAQVGIPGKTNSFFALINEQEIASGKIFSLASVLAKHAKDKAAGVILKYDEHYAVCCINKSTPVIDNVFNNSADAVRELRIIAKRLGFKPIIDFDGPPDFEYDESLAAKLIGPKKVRVNSIKDVPQAPLKYIILISLFLVGAYFYLDYKEQERAKEEAARLQAIKDADPVPKYLRNLVNLEPSFALPETAVFKMLGRLAPIPQLPEGWVFAQATCGLPENKYTCKLEYKRVDGIYSDLIKALGNFKLRFDGPTNLNEAFAYADLEPEAFKFPEYENTYEKFAEKDYGDKGQIWLTAGLGVSEKSAQLWPETAGVASKFKHPMAIMKGEIKVTNMPIELFGDFMKTKPENMHVESFTVKTGMVDKELVSKIDVSTVYHVKQNID